MKNPVYIMLISVLFYAITNSILEIKLAKYSTVVLVAMFYLVMGGVSLIHLFTLKEMGADLQYPPLATFLGWGILAAITYYLAAVFDVQAYHVGGKASVIATVFITMPIMTHIIMGITKKRVPEFNEFIGFGIVAIGIFWLAKYTNLFVDNVD